MARINYLDNLSDQVIKKQAVLQEKTADKNKKVTELENSVNELVRIVTEQLTDIREDEPEIGTIPYTLAVLEEFLNQQVITLPKILKMKNLFTRMSTINCLKQSKITLTSHRP